ncbi:MAG: hypothetical protein FWC45_08700, partial [Treponema sp.]|nr:hypothetical protein [Treponema sp.]
MKKAFVVLLLLAVMAGGLFAQAAASAPPATTIAGGAFVTANNPGLAAWPTANAPTLTVQGKFDGEWVPIQYISKTSYNATGDEITTSLWGAGFGRDSGTYTSPRTGIFITAGNDVVGMKIQFRMYFFNNPGYVAKIVGAVGDTTVTVADQIGVGPDDNMMIWWKPVKQFTISAGKYVDDTLRGKIGDAGWIRKFSVGSYNNDAIFTRFNSGGVDIGGSGTLGVLGLYNANNLIIGINFQQLKPFWNSGNNAGQNVLWGNGVGGGGSGQNADYETVNFNDGNGQLGRVMARTQFAVGYNIPNIGLIRAQYVGANVAFGNNPSSNGFDNIVNNQYAGGLNQRVYGPRIEAAFAYLGVKNLTVDFGAKYVLPQKASAFHTWNAKDLKWDDTYYYKDPTTSALEKVPAGTYKAPVQIGLGANYASGNFQVYGRVDCNFAGGADIDESAPGAGDAETLKQGMDLNFQVEPGYNFGFMKLIGQLAFAMRGETTRESAG